MNELLSSATSNDGKDVFSVICVCLQARGGGPYPMMYQEVIS